MDNEDDDDQTTVDSNQGNNNKNRMNDFTFMGGNGEFKAMDEKLSKYTSVEGLREYLEEELGEAKLMKAYPILKDFVIFKLTY